MARFTSSIGTTRTNAITHARTATTANGRIYKIVYQDQKVSRVDFAKMSDDDLLKQVTSRNEFMSRQSRLQLQYRAAQQAIGSTAAEGLRTTLCERSTSPARLRALWALHVTAGLDAKTAIENLKNPDEWVRAWTIQLAFDSRENVQRLLQEIREKDLKADPDLEKLAQDDPSPLVRLFIASAAQRIENQELRGNLVKSLLRHKEDAATIIFR